MVEMIERVALAIYRDNAYTGSSTDWAGEEWDEVDERLCKQIARVAIEAMHKPTEEMLSECTTAFGEAIWDGETFWKAMLNIALGKDSLDG